MKKPSADKSEKRKTSKRQRGSGALRARPSVKSANGNPREITLKQRRYVQGRLDGKTKKQSALDAGYTQRMAENATQKIDTKPGVQELFSVCLERAGISDDLLAVRIREGLDATQTKTATADGKITDTLELVDYAARANMIELTARLKGHLVERHEVDVRGEVRHVVDRLTAARKRLQESIERP